MDVAFLVLNDHSESLNGKIYLMGGGWNMLRLPSLPYEWSFGIALGLDVPWGETNMKHELTLHTEDPDGGILGDQLGMDLETGRPAGSIEGQDQRVVLSLGTRLTFSQAGPHAVLVRVADEEIGRTRFYIAEAPPGQAEAESEGLD
ncbi:MAG: hypothetical protein EXQ70_03955 [Solirubrobacterales bacterium]|nr:hypothetical protein [Solirubrobacterales bacterium]